MSMPSRTSWANREAALIRANALFCARQAAREVRQAAREVRHWAGAAGGRRGRPAAGSIRAASPACVPVSLADIARPIAVARR
jgi:hypothetical protein